MKQIRYLAGSLVVLGLLGGCKPYRALPLDQKVKDAALAAPDLAQTTIRAQELKHPLLRPLAIDLRDGLSPEEAAVLAVVANPDLKAIRDQRALAAAQLLEAGLLPDPVLAYGQDVPAGSDKAAYVTASTTQLSLDLTALLTRGLRRRAAQAEQQSVDLAVAWQEWQVAEAAKLSVYRLRALSPQVALADDLATAQEETLKAVERSSATGDAVQGDVATARAAADVARRNTLALLQARDREGHQLNALLGLPPHVVVTLEKASARQPWTKLPAEQELIQDLDQRLDLLAFQKGYASQDARVRLAVWSQFPSIGLSLSRTLDTSNVLTHGNGVAVTLRLFNRGQGLVAMENATRQQLRDQYLARLFQARSDLVQILVDLQAVKQMLATAEAAVPSLSAQAAASEAAFSQGSLDLVSRNQARVALLTQKAVVVSLEAALDEFGVALEIATGRTLQPRETK